MRCGFEVSKAHTKHITGPECAYVSLHTPPPQNNKCLMSMHNCPEATKIMRCWETVEKERGGKEGEGSGVEREER